VESDQVKRLGELLRNRRESLGLSQRQIAERAGVNDATIVRIEHDEINAPAPDKLSRIAEALGLPLADVFALARYVVPNELPSFTPYLRTRYHGMPDAAIADLDDAFARIVKQHGYRPEGPTAGEDETPE
jgi:transcriptional regulator with XRE-family HTH domain